MACKKKESRSGVRPVGKLYAIVVSPVAVEVAMRCTRPVATLEGRGGGRLTRYHICQKKEWINTCFVFGFVLLFSGLFFTSCFLFSFLSSSVCFVLHLRRLLSFSFFVFIFRFSLAAFDFVRSFHFVLSTCCFRFRS